MKDLLITDKGDLLIEDGDFVIGDSTLQNQALLLTAQPGEFKEYALMGIGMENYILNSDLRGCEYETRRQFTLDGMKVNKLDFTDWDNLKIQAEYE